ncbi:uncharacterized protein LOC132562393 [Ylistrum balloti]|uniref:uncharacterized protein LOC132562393 n=1 Tax=Ylistrum balloti TaxID=509963 RepID=UPI002905D33A|nr:uncharacterized protein LOC132562393 [Ylistrum balloti]
MNVVWLPIALVVIANIVTTAKVSDQGCLDMYVFSSTYATISNTIGTLEGQVKTLKGQLDNILQSACLEPGPNTDTTTRFNLTYCDFEDGHLCNYVNKGSSYAWNLYSAIPNVRDHTYMGAKAGHFIRTYDTSSLQLTSRMFDKANSYCIRFYLRATNTSSQFVVYIKEDGGVGYPIYSPAPHTPTTWSLVEIVPDQEYLSKPFQIAFQVLSGGYAFLDDIMVYNAPCHTPGIRKPVSCNGKELTIDRTKHCYTAHIEPRTYIDAIRACKKEWPQNHLLSVTSATVQQYIVNWIHNDSGLSAAGGPTGFWTSGQDEFKEGDFYWASDLEPVKFNYTSWHVGQPNNVGGHQNCVLLEYANDNYNWGDVDCGERHPFICEAVYT